MRIKNRVKLENKTFKVDKYEKNQVYGYGVILLYVK